LARRNRVDPFGRLIESPARGAWFGNRGCLHDAAGVVHDRAAPTRRWIVCRLAFKGRRRKLLQPGRYTELFFLDEATALAAGHRPCFECRRRDALAFAEAWQAGHGLAARPRADALDAALAAQRRPAARETRPSLAACRDLPDGAMAAVGGAAYLIHGGRFFRWAPGGYAPDSSVPGPATILTPAGTRRALAALYRAQIDPSASR
jgi:hypothetical protein